MRLYWGSWITKLVTLPYHIADDFHKIRKKKELAPFHWLCSPLSLPWSSIFFLLPHTFVFRLYTLLLQITFGNWLPGGRETLSWASPSYSSEIYWSWGTFVRIMPRRRDENQGGGARRNSHLERSLNLFVGFSFSTLSLAWVALISKCKTVVKKRVCDFQCFLLG